LLHLSDLPTVHPPRKKLTYDQAWAVCKAKMDKARVAGTGFLRERTLHPGRKLHETIRT